MSTKETSPELSTLAAQVLNGSKTPTAEEIRKLAACVLSQDETPGQEGLEPDLSAEAAEEATEAE